jgi:hypothetical protein
MKQSERAVLRRWTRHEYERLIDHGFLDEDDPIELLDGLLLVKEPQHSLHRTAVLLVAKAVERAFGEGWFVQTQSPIILDDRSEPEPDVCVVRGSPRDYVDSHPRRPSLIVEVAQSGVEIARGRKPRHTHARGSRTTGSSTSPTARSKFIASRRDQVRVGGIGATRPSPRRRPVRNRLRERLRAIRRDWSGCVRIHLDEDVLAAARLVIQRHALRGFDGIHLVSALTLQSRWDETVVVATASRPPRPARRGHRRARATP